MRLSFHGELFHTMIDELWTDTINRVKSLNIRTANSDVSRQTMLANAND